MWVDSDTSYDGGCLNFTREKWWFDSIDVSYGGRIVKEQLSSALKGQYHLADFLKNFKMDAAQLSQLTCAGQEFLLQVFYWWNIVIDYMW